MKKVRALMVGLVLGVAMQVCAADALTEALQKGLFEEEANQNLEAAIKAYQDVLGRAEEQRRIAATALFRLAECYRKQGKTNEASAEYRRLVRDYSDQATLVNLSRQNLVGLGVTGTVASTTAASQSPDPLTTDEEQQEIQRIRALIKNSPDLINAKNRTFTPVGSGPVTGTVLHEAAFKGHLLVAEYLLANGGDVNALNTYQATPLYHAAHSGHKRVVELLLEKGAKPSLGALPLHAAAERGFIGVAEVLLASKADVNAAPRGQTALHVAIEHNNLQIAELLLANGANVNVGYSRKWNSTSGSRSDNPLYALGKLDGTPLHFAVQSRNPAAVRVLLDKGADANARSGAGLVPLHYAANPDMRADNAVQIAEMLLAAGAKIDATGDENDSLSGWAPLHIAVFHKLPHVTGLLLEKGADPNLPLPAQSGNEGTALNMAVSGGATEIVELLLKHKADVNAPGGNTPLLRATMEQNRQVAELLLAHKADINALNIEGNTALAIAVPNRDVPLAELLLSKGANPNTTNNEGYPLLHVAIGLANLRQRGAPPPGAFETRLRTANPSTSPLPQPQTRSVKTMFDLLIEYKADPNIRDRQGKTALHHATTAGAVPLIEMLLAKKADINARGPLGNTALHGAVHHESLVRVLLEHKADVNATNGMGDTPLFYGLDNTNIVQLLAQHGADVNWCNNAGETPLIRMLKKHSSQGPYDLDFNRVLLEAGADVLKSCGGMPSAFEYVQQLESERSGLMPVFTELLRKYHTNSPARIDLEGAIKRRFWFFDTNQPPPTLSHVIAEVGVSEKANPQAVDVFRYDPKTGFKRGTRYDLVAIREKRAPDVSLQPGDRVHVPTRSGP